MSWRNNPGSSGANTIPLGNRRRFGGDDYDDRQSRKRDRSPEPDQKPVRRVEYNPDGTRKRIKPYRWAPKDEANKAAGLINLPTTLPSNSVMTIEQKDAYVMHFRIEEISAKLRINDVLPSERFRSPSPPPQYDNQGRRINTREYRYRKKLEDERHKLVEQALQTIPSYQPPHDYRRPTKTQEKIFVPVNDYPEINFIGLLIGPRGNTLKKMEADSGAKIAIRGKGSVKEGKGKSDAAHASNQDEPLHCLIMADTEDKIEKAKRLIANVIETAASTPETQNELKRNQLRELAALNGTLRDDENQACQNCGEIGHRKYDCPHQQNRTANIICRVCGNAGHFARDCPDRVKGQDWRSAPPRGPAQGDQFDNFMNEIGGNATFDPSRQIGFQNGGGAPWESSNGGGAAPWEQSGGSAPWDQGGRGGGGGGGGAPWQQDSYGGRGHHDQGGYGGGYGGGGYGHNNGYGGGYNNHGGHNGSGGGAAPWDTGAQGHSAPPPPPPSDNIPPPPPGHVPPPPPS